MFGLYGFDKQKAKKQQNRVSERALLMSSMSFGSLGALIGMYFWHHKTNKRLFVVFNTLMLIIHVYILVVYGKELGIY